MVSLNLDAVQWHQKSRRTALVDLGPKVIINKNGRISISRSAIRQLGDSPDAMRVGFIPEGSIIVMQVSSSDDSDAYKLTEQARSFSLGVGKFFEDRHIDVDETRTYIPNIDADHGIIYFSLNEPEPTEQQRPKRGRPPKAKTVA